MKADVVAVVTRVGEENESNLPDRVEARKRAVAAGAAVVPDHGEAMPGDDVPPQADHHDLASGLAPGIPGRQHREAQRISGRALMFALRYNSMSVAVDRRAPAPARAGRSTAQPEYPRSHGPSPAAPGVRESG